MLSQGIGGLSPLQWGSANHQLPSSHLHGRRTLLLHSGGASQQPEQAHGYSNTQLLAAQEKLVLLLPV